MRNPSAYSAYSAVHSLTDLRAVTPGEEWLRRVGTEKDLAARRKKDPGKLAIAARVRKQPTLPIKRIAELLLADAVEALSG